VGQTRFPYKRTIIFGSTGIGKTTLVKRIAEEFSLPVIDIDSLRREAGKSDAPDETFSHLVMESVKEDIWIIDGSYTSVQDVIWPRAEAIVWLDFSFGIFLSRLIKRSLYRIFIRKKSEKPIKARNQAASERAGTYLRAIFTGKQRRQRYFATLYNAKNVHLHIIRLSDPEEVQLWLDLFKNHH
jgi:adenylate kinase family enzyme